MQQLRSPLDVHHAVMSLGDATATAYIDVAFYDLLAAGNYTAPEVPAAYQIAQIANILSLRVPLVDIFATYANRCFVLDLRLPLADVFMAKIVRQRMTKDPQDTLRVILAVRENLDESATSSLLNFVGTHSPGTALRDLLQIPLTSELRPSQFDHLFAGNEELRLTSYYTGRPGYLRRLIYQALPKASAAQQMALLLAPTWEGNIECLLETCAELSSTSVAL
jgi:hypothetical protein